MRFHSILKGTNTILGNREGIKAFAWWQCLAVRYTPFYSGTLNSISPLLFTFSIHFFVLQCSTCHCWSNWTLAGRRCCRQPPVDVWYLCLSASGTHRYKAGTILERQLLFTSSKLKIVEGEPLSCYCSILNEQHRLDVNRVLNKLECLEGAIELAGIVILRLDGELGIRKVETFLCMLLFGITVGSVQL